jgi:hypothetical protein
VRLEGRIGVHQAANLGQGAFRGEELSRTVLQNFLAFAQSKLHGAS